MTLLVKKNQTEYLEKEVFAEINPVGRDEFTAARQKGYKASMMIEVWGFEYEGQTEIMVDAFIIVYFFYAFRNPYVILLSKGISRRILQMKIAVTYEGGSIFQHFGKTETFKMYEVEDGKITSMQIVHAGGAGHSALAGFLSEQSANVLICGGIGEGAQEALKEAGIKVISGAAGEVDAAVNAYLAGELESAGTNCDHHHEEGHSCCGQHEETATEEASAEEEHSCGGHCSGCSGCGGAHVPDFEGPNVGKTCRTHYRGTFDDGTQFDSSYDRGEPLEFVCGAGQMIHGYDKAVATMEVGQTINIHLMPEEAYGMPDPRAIFTLEIAQLPGSEDLEVGARAYLTNQYGQPFPVTVTEKTETNITFDANHEMAGKELNFQIELVEVK
ncbi:MAG: NifB/NifX family molybdenum-iron cluster-binding protein [Phocaeicola vulgatus]|nr:NifB/NifX family molybdenum-iron cluster-binding protein [Phocaeicola vulgatus]